MADDQNDTSEIVDEETSIPPPDWEALISQIAEDIVTERSPARILQVRAKLYDLLTHCIPATTILKVGFQPLPLPDSSVLNMIRPPQTLTFKLIPKVDAAVQGEIVKWSSFYEHRIKMGSVSSFLLGRKYLIHGTLLTRLG